MSKKNLYDFLNTPAFNTIQQMQDQLDNCTFSITMRELQDKIDAMKVSTNGITAAIQAYQDSVAPLTATIQNINNLYAPILEQTHKYEDLYNDSMIAALQNSIYAMEAMAGFDFSAIQSIANAFSKYDFWPKSILENINFDAVAQMYDEGIITDEDIADELKEIVAKKDFSLSKSWDDVKKSKWFLAIRCIFVVLMFFCSPVIDKVKDNVLETLGVNEFWEESGIYEWLDELFGIENDKGTVTELQAKETIDNTKTGNHFSLIS